MVHCSGFVSEPEAKAKGLRFRFRLQHTHRSCKDLLGIRKVCFSPLRGRKSRAALVVPDCCPAPDWNDLVQPTVALSRGMDGGFATIHPFGGSASTGSYPQALELCVPVFRRVCLVEDERRWNPSGTARPAPEGCHQSWQLRLLDNPRTQSPGKQTFFTPPPHHRQFAAYRPVPTARPRAPARFL